MAFLRTKVGFFVCILLPMALFFLFELYKFILTVISVKNGDDKYKLDEEEIKRRAIEEYLAAQKANEDPHNKHGGATQYPKMGAHYANHSDQDREVTDSAEAPSPAASQETNEEPPATSGEDGDEQYDSGM